MASYFTFIPFYHIVFTSSIPDILTKSKEGLENKTIFVYNDTRKQEEGLKCQEIMPIIGLAHG